ncbi:heterokaryon incompatibility protein-domain-containing protein [Tricladium varicosporioides]|nr:heterokaryon incompatibility protein-domain-containing protein [Hymenoscyphus varicosporioides]
MAVKPHPLTAGERRRSLVDVELYTTPGLPSKWVAFGPAPHIHSEVITDNSLDQISSWIDDCKTNHQGCNRRTNFGIPSRLLSVAGMDDDEIPIIRLEDTDITREYEYVALSHVWSLTSPLKTTLENLPKHQQAVSWNDLSIGLREVIILTMCLGITHIWIDSLCIIQDSSQDWESECPRMGHIYGEATVVFAAHGPELGFQKAPTIDLRDPDPSRKDDNPIHARLRIDHKNIFSVSHDAVTWLGRGWCMQERFFAPRLLHFGGYCEEVFFECNTHTRCECSRIIDGRMEDRIYTLKSRLTNALAEAVRISDDTQVLDDLWRAYILVCEDYTARGLTYSSDTLPAISSLMSQFSPFFGAYYAGIWERHLILSLQWESLNTQYCHRHREYVAPSWSWASRSGAVIWYMNSTTLRTPVPTSATHEFAAIVCISCTAVGVDPFGKVSAGQLILRGYVTKMKISSTQLLIPDGRMEMRKEGMDGKKEECYVTFDAIEDAQETTEGEILTCLDILRDKKGLHGNFVTGLVLRKVEGKDRVYKRVGFSTMKAEHFVGSKIIEVTII